MSIQPPVNIAGVKQNRNIIGIAAVLIRQHKYVMTSQVPFSITLGLGLTVGLQEQFLIV